MFLNFAIFIVVVHKICLSQYIELNPSNPIFQNKFSLSTLQGYLKIIIYHNYSPLKQLVQIGSIEEHYTQDSLIAYIMNENQGSIAFASYLTLDDQSKSINQNFNFQVDNIQSTLSYSHENILQYEGVWIQQELIIKDSYFQIAIIDYVSSNILYFYEEFFPLTIENSFILQFGGILDKKPLLLKQFKGMIQVNLINNDNNYENLFLLCPCYWYPYQYITTELIISPLQYNQFYANNYTCSQFYFRTWAKMTETTDFINAYIIHLDSQSLQDYTKQVGGTTLQLQYIYNSKNTKYYLKLKTYSYTYPITFISDDSQQLEDLIEISSNIFEWHYFTVTYNNRILTILIEYFIENAQISKQYQDIYYFSNINMKIYLGGTPIEFSQSLGILVQTIYETCPFRLIELTQCHYSCNKCYGPYDNNCLNCDTLEFRIYDEQLKTCKCIFGYLETYQATCYSTGGQYTRIQTPLSSKVGQDYDDPLYCAIGYFKYQNECRLCPQIEQGILCIECIENPESWADSLRCSGSRQKDNNQLYTYQFDHQYYEMTYVDGELQQTRNNLIYSSDTNICVKNQMDQIYCINCIDNSKYYLSVDRKTCNECLIPNCKYCFSFNQYDRSINSLETYQIQMFFTASSDDVTGCALCFDGYQFNFLNQQCELRTPKYPCLQDYIDTNGDIICLLTITSDFSEGNAISNCQSLIPNCFQCISTQDNLPRCIKCETGYYIDIITSNCFTCTQMDLYTIDCLQLDTSGFTPDYLYEIISFYNNFIPGKKYYNQQPYSTILVATSCKQNYIIQYYRCIQIKNDGCLTLEDSKELKICQQCSDSKYGIKRLTVTQNQICVSCPSFCEYCVTRTIQEIELINPYFQLTAENQPLTNRCLQKADLPHIFLDNKIGLVKICEKLEKCQSQIIQRIDYDYNDFFQLNQLSYPYPNSDYLNYWQFDTLTFHYTFYNDQFETTSQHIDVEFKSFQQDSAFALQYAELILEGKQDQNVNFSFGFIKFRFRTLRIINFNLLFSLSRITVLYCYSEIGINIYLQNFEISYSNIESLPIETAIYNRQKWFEIYNLEILEANKLIIRDVILVNSIFFNVTGSDQMLVSIEQIIIKNCTLINSTLFQFQQQMAQFKLIDIQILDCIFLNSSIISTKIYYLKIDVLIQNIQLNKLIIQQSVLFDLPISQLVTIEDLTISESEFQDSRLIQLKNNVYFHQILVQNCHFIQSSIIININTIDQSQIVSIIMDTITIVNINYKSMKILNLLPQDGIQYDIQLSNFNFTNIAIENIQLINRKVKSSLNYLQGNTLIMKNFYLEREVGFIDFYLSLFQNLVIDNMIVKQSSKLAKQYIQIHQECVQQNAGQSQLLAINGVFNLEISNLFVQDQFLEDQILLQIYNTQDTYNFENSTIIIRDCQFIGNSLIKIQKQLQVSLISINYQTCKLIQIINLEFRLTWLNQYSQDPQSTSRSSVMTIFSNQQTIQLEQIQLINNILTNSTDPLIQLYSNNITINNVNAFEANYLNFQQFKFRMMLNNNNNLTLAQLTSQFPINSYGGVFAISGELIVVSNSQFTTTRALQGGVLYCVLQQNSQIQIKNIIIQDSQTTLENEPNSQGGSIYIDASRATANIQILDVKVMQSFSRFSGGFLFINPSITFNNYFIENVYLENCNSLYNSLIFIQFNVLYAVKNFIEIKNIKIKNEELVYNQFLTDIGYDTKQQTLIDGIGQIYLKNCNFSLTNITYTGLIVQPIIEITTLKQLIMQSIKIINVKFMVPYFIKIQIYGDSKAFIQLQNLQIINASQFKYDDKYLLTSCSQLQLETLNMIPNCQNQKSIFSINDNVDESINQLKQYCNRHYLTNQDTISLIIIQISVQQYLFMQSLRFYDVKCETCYNGLLFIKGSILNQKMLIKESLFQNNNCGYSGCFKIQGQQQLNLLIDNSRMITNKAINGSGIFIDFNYSNQLLPYSSMIVQNSYFSNNSAIAYGGALYINQEDQSFFNILNSILDRNQANIGGALYFTNLSPSLSSIQLTQNLGTNSLNNIGSAIYKLKLQMKSVIIPSISILSTDGSTIDIPDYELVKMQDHFLRLPTGQEIALFRQFLYSSLDTINLSLSLQLLAVNQAEEQIIQVQDSQCQLYHREIDPNNEQGAGSFIQDDTFSFNQVSFNSTSQSFNLDSLVIAYSPYQQNLLEIDVNCTNFQINNYHYRFRVKTYKCQQGEVFANESCILCDASKGYYSTNPFQNECSRIDITKISNITSGMLKLNQGYWRPDYKSNQIEYCKNNPYDCLGGWNVSNNLCAISKIGALCEECDISNIQGQGKYSKQSQRSCYSCSAFTNQVIKAIAISLWTLFLVTMTVQSINNSNLELNKLKNFTKHFDIVFRKNQDQTGSLIKMATNYLQIIQIIYTFQVKFFVDSSQYVLTVSNPVQQVTYNLDCSLADISPTNLIYIRIIWIIILPFCYFPIFTAFYFIVIKYKKVKFDFGVVATTLIYLFIYTQPNLIQELVQLFSIRMISGMQWIKADVSYLYYTDLHENWVFYFILPVMALYGLLIPILLTYKLVQHRKQLNNLRVRTIWAYVYNEYTKKSYFWEIIRILQRELIILIIIYYDQNILLKGCLTILTILIYLGIVINQHPYNQESLNKYEQHNIFLCILIILLSLILKNVQDNLLTSLEISIQILLILALVCLFYNIITKVLAAYYQKMDQTLDPLRIQLLKRFPRLTIICPFLKKYLRIKIHQKELIQYRYSLIKRHFKSTTLHIPRKSIMPAKHEIFTQRNELVPLNGPIDSENRNG